ncbi:cystathionine gamma-lyase cys3 [Leucoagaricus gongylophorus]
MTPLVKLKPLLNGVVDGAANNHRQGFSTQAIHVGSEPNSETGAVIPPISLATTYKQDSIGVHKGFEYSRSSNPNRNALERTLASLELGGGHALAFASGSSTTATVLQSLGPNAHVISVNDVYGGTFRYMSRVAKENQGLQTTFMDLENLSGDGGEFLDEIRHNTKLIWIETPTNPTLRLISIPSIRAHISKLDNPPLILVDNTFLSPYYSSPLLLGADVVLHSLTKYINGHSDVVMGALILPDTPFHTELVNKLRFLQNAIGAVPSAYDSWLAQRGAKTLALRMKAHGTNALALARALKDSPLVEDIIYPGLASHPRHHIAWESLSPHAKKWIEGLPERLSSTADFPYSGMISFRIKGGLEAANTFLTSTRLFALAESLGGVESLAEHPAKMTHGSIPPAEREKLGISDGLIRLSVGVEDEEDLVQDVLQALEKAAGHLA